MKDVQRLVEGKDYYEVPGIDLDGKPTTFKILINEPNQKDQEKKHHEQ